MAGLQPPAVPAFTPGTPAGTQLVALLNAGIRDPLSFLLNKPRARLRRVAALNTAANQHQYIPMDTADEDNYGGWTAPAALGGGMSTTLNGATLANATSIVVLSGTGAAVGDFVKVDTLANAEYRQISAVAGTTITVSTPLRIAHSTGVAVVEQTSDPSRYVVRAPGWYRVTASVSLSGTGAAGMCIVGSVAVNENSQTSIGTAGWEGSVPYVPVTGATDPKVSSSLWEVYANLGDYIQADLWYSNESAITAVDTTAGRECTMRLVWAGL